jgi:hypothetical protein
MNYITAEELSRELALRGHTVPLSCLEEVARSLNAKVSREAGIELISMRLQLQGLNESNYNEMFSMQKTFEGSF